MFVLSLEKDPGPNKANQRAPNRNSTNGINGNFHFSFSPVSSQKILQLCSFWLSKKMCSQNENLFYVVHPVLALVLATKLVEI